MLRWQRPSTDNLDRAVEHLMRYRGILEVMSHPLLRLKPRQLMVLKVHAELSVVGVTECLTHSIVDFLHNNEAFANAEFVGHLLAQCGASMVMPHVVASAAAVAIHNVDNIFSLMPSVGPLASTFVDDFESVDPVIQFVHNFKVTQLRRAHWLKALKALHRSEFRADKARVVQWAVKLYIEDTTDIMADIDHLAERFPELARLMFYGADRQSRQAMERYREFGSDCNSDSD
jgi:hypothetical protein